MYKFILHCTSYIGHVKIQEDLRKMIPTTGVQGQ